MLVIAGFLAYLSGKMVRRAYKRRRDRRPDVAVRPNPKEGAEIVVAIAAACLLAMAIWAICVHR